jgi:SWI/SNF-related matrix-associated actin-dependent regulator of chromatin subfamily A3
MADRRLCLTGTPVQNKLDDVYALIRFLRFNPFDDKAIWSEYIGGPAKFGQPLGVARLQTIMKSVTLRRTKESTDADGKKILDLPPRHDEVRYLKFDDTEKTVYDSYYSESKAEFSQLRKNGEVMKNYVGILQKILRLRQICDHYELVKGKDEIVSAEAMDYDQIMSSIAREGITITSATAIFSLLRDAGTSQCVECGLDLAAPGATALLDGTELDGPSTSKRARKTTKGPSGSRGPTRASSPSGPRPVITRCQHLYCIECFRLSICPNWPKVRAEIHRACSVCQADLSPLADAVEVSPDGLIPSELAPKNRPVKKEKRQKGAGLLGYNASTKVRALLGDLMATSQQNPNSANFDPNIANEIQMTDSHGDEIDEGQTKTVVL